MTPLRTPGMRIASQARLRLGVPDGGASAGSRPAAAAARRIRPRKGVFARQAHTAGWGDLDLRLKLSQSTQHCFSITTQLYVAV